MSKVFITGGSGQLGKSLQRLNPSWNFLDSSYDISKYDLIESKLQNKDIDILINCAAYTNVDGAESYEEEALRVNQIGVRNLVQLAQKKDFKLIQISTDYVFGGDQKTPYDEKDIPSPKSVYGRSKLLGEQEILNTKNIKYAIVRTSWLYSEQESSFVGKIKNKLRNDEVINVVNDQIGSPTFVDDLASFIKELINKEYEGIIHFSNDGEISWYDLACEIQNITGFGSQKINSISTESLNLAANRPRYSVLSLNNLKKLFPNHVFDWKESLKKCLK